MNETARLGLPLVQAAQAQKHVTVNEALARLDGLVQLRLAGVGVTVPPVAADGAVYAVGAGGTGAFAGQDGMLAVADNGGWQFVAPEAGWSAWDVAGGVALRFSDGVWLVEGGVRSSGGARTVTRIVEADVVLGAGGSATTADLIPSHAQVTGVTARVVQAITGTATSWRLGVPGAVDRHGAGLGLGAGSYALGITGSPVVYWADTPLVLTAEGGDFAGGTVRVAVHMTELVPPAAA